MMIFFFDWINQRALEKRKRELAEHRKKMWGPIESQLNAQWFNDRRKKPRETNGHFPYTT